MSLDDVTSGGNYDPIAKYNAKAGKWSIRFSKEDERDVDSPTFVADFDNVMKGWVLYLEGQAPDEMLVPASEAFPAKPSENHKKTIKLRVFSDSFFEGVAVFAPTSMHALDAIKELYRLYDEDKKDGKLPVVEFTGSETMRDKMGTNYKPQFKILKWVDRPAAFDEEAPANDDAPVEEEKPSKASASEF